MAGSRTGGGSSRGLLTFWDVTFSLDTSTYADGDVLADTQLVGDQFFEAMSRTCLIQSVQVLDESHQAAAFDLLFLNANVSIGTENASVSVSDANARSIVGLVSVADTDYIDLANSSQAWPQFNPFVIGAAADARALYIAAVSRGTGTYGAAGIRVRIGAIQ